MPSLKEYNLKLLRLSNTRKMTKTMKMVSANKLRKSQDILQHALTFETNMTRAAGVAKGKWTPHPLTSAHQAQTKALVVLITSDKGMCGGFNNNLSKKVLSWMETDARAHSRVSMWTCGRRGALFFRNRAKLQHQYEDIVTKTRLSSVLKLAADLQEAFLNADTDVVYVAFNRFKSALTQEPVIERLLPLDIPSADETPAVESIADPSPNELAAHVLPKVLFARLFAAVAASIAGEHGARMTAMDNASANCDKLITQYTLLRNRARQAAITRELIEIVAGAEALN